jgi:RNA polymerase sigma-70 factor (ECF subfamily)
MGVSSEEITTLLKEFRNGDRTAESKLMALVYADLRRRAAFYLRRERSDHTLQPTALVHEAYLRLVEQPGGPWQNRVHFYAVAARAMRQVLVDHARTRGAEKRGGNDEVISLDEAFVPSREKSRELVELDDALNRLAHLDVRQARVVELRYFGGLSVEETAQVVGLSTRQVKRD